MLVAGTAAPYGESILPKPKNEKALVIARLSLPEGSKDLLAEITRVAGLGVDYINVGVLERDGKVLVTAPGAGADAPTAEFGAVLDAAKGKCNLVLSVASPPSASVLEALKAREMRAGTLFRGKDEVLARVATEPSNILRLPEVADIKELPDELVDREAHGNGRSDGRRGRLLGRAPKVIKRRPPAVITNAAQFSAAFAEKCALVEVLPLVEAGAPEAWEKALKEGARGIETDHPGKLIQWLQAGAAH